MLRRNHEEALTASLLKELLSYDPETGIFVSIKTVGKRRAGKIVGEIRKGRITISICGERFFAHRLAWLYVTGQWPIDTVDHIDLNPMNNRWINLRMATESEQKWNLPVVRKNGRLVGAVKRKHRDLWMASIKIYGKKHYIGDFKTEAEAHAAYLEAKSRLHVIDTYPKDEVA